MRVDDICKALREIDVKYFLDTLNPDFTVHIARTGALIDTISHNAGPWHLVTLDNQFTEITSIDQLKVAVVEHLKDVENGI